METPPALADSTITVRLEPKTKFFTVLLAKRAGLTLSEFVQTCVDSCLQLTSIEVAGNQLNYADLRQQLWAEHPADRFALLALLYPSELTVRERNLWNKIVRPSDEFWHVPLDQQHDAPTAGMFRFERLRDRWDEFESFDRNDVAALAKTAKQQRNAEWSSRAIPQQRTLMQRQDERIDATGRKQARKRKRKE